MGSDRKESTVSDSGAYDFAHIVTILKSLKKSLSMQKYKELIVLSDETVASAAVHQHPMHVILAVFTYALSKIYQRDYYRTMEGWKEFDSVLLKNLDGMIKAAEAKNANEVVRLAGEIRNVLNSLSGNLRIYIQDIFRKAEINKAFKVYEHGVSAQQTADLLGVNLWDLASYFGRSHIGEAKIAQSLPVGQRISYAENIFS
ncbi:MAG: hypothetical protein ACI83O_000905 [Patescibacteria group bacterium]|jgi:hypothetical protein